MTLAKTDYAQREGKEKRQIKLAVFASRPLICSAFRYFHHATFAADLRNYRVSKLYFLGLDDFASFVFR